MIRKLKEHRQRLLKDKRIMLLVEQMLLIKIGLQLMLLLKQSHKLKLGDYSLIGVELITLYEVLKLIGEHTYKRRKLLTSN